MVLLLIVFFCFFWGGSVSHRKAVLVLYAFAKEGGGERRKINEAAVLCQDVFSPWLYSADSALDGEGRGHETAVCVLDVFSPFVGFCLTPHYVLAVFAVAYERAFVTLVQTIGKEWPNWCLSEEKKIQMKMKMKGRERVSTHFPFLLETEEGKQAPCSVNASVVCPGRVSGVGIRSSPVRKRPSLKMARFWEEKTVHCQSCDVWGFELKRNS